MTEKKLIQKLLKEFVISEDEISKHDMDSYTIYGVVDKFPHNDKVIGRVQFLDKIKKLNKKLPNEFYIRGDKIEK